MKPPKSTGHRSASPRGKKTVKANKSPPGSSSSSSGGGGSSSGEVCVSAGHQRDFETHLRDLWDLKEIENGMVKVPRIVLEELLHKEDISSLYDVEETPVACGLFATVRKCTHKETGITYAAKFSSRYRNGGVDVSMEVLHEIAMLSLCNSSSHIVHLRDVFQNRNEIILVLEYAPGGDFQHVLDDDMVPFEEDVVSYMIQVLEALQFLHDRSVAHLDIKPQNIVLMGRFPNCEIKLCDLEVARVIQEDEEIREIIGTPDYVAPEIISMDPITLASDIWSVGVLAYVLLTGFSPFGGENDQDTLRNITSGILDFPHELFEGVSEAAKDFIKSCLKKDAKQRPSVTECLKSSWLVPSSEPPSPSPLMLKIPTPDPPSSHRHSPSPRRSCLTCRNRATERKRYLSKSREALFEKVAANSNLRKSLSKSKERLVVDLSLSLSSKGGKGGRKKRRPEETQPIAGGGEEGEDSQAQQSQATRQLPELPEEEASEEDRQRQKPSDTPWRSELAKYTSTKPSRVAELIGSFDPSRSGQRRGSLQMESLEVKSSAKSAEASHSSSSSSSSSSNGGSSAESSSSTSTRELKLQRRKSASAIPPLRLSTPPEQPRSKNSRSKGGKKQEEPEIVKKVLVEGDEIGNKSSSSSSSSSPVVRKGEKRNNKSEGEVKKEEERRVYSGRQRKPDGKKWDYFEIDHPKAISDKKLMQLKAKYARKSGKKSGGGSSKAEDKENKDGDIIPKAEEKEPSKDIVEKKQEEHNESIHAEGNPPPPNNGSPIASADGLKSESRKGGSSLRRRKDSEDKEEGPIKRSEISRPELLFSSPPGEEDNIPDNAFLEVIVNPLTSMISTKTVPKGLNNRRYSSPLFLHGDGPKMIRTRSNSITADLSFLNPVHRMCNGAFSRAFERYSLATNNTNNNNNTTTCEEEESDEPPESPQQAPSSLLRRRSSPILKTS